MAFTARTIFAALVVTALGISGCTEECTAVGCTDSITVTFDHAIERNYTVAITFNGQKGTADCTSATNPGPEVTVPVSGLDRTITCTQTGVLLQGAPEDVVFDFTFQDGTVATVGLKPEYETVEPNGPDCDPTCDQAEVEVVLP